MEKKNLLSIELERALVYHPKLEAYPPLGEPYGSATPASLQAILSDLVNQGWEPILDPCTKVLLRVRKPYDNGNNTAPFWTCTSDVTTGIFETTLAPSLTISELEQQQRALDEETRPILQKHGLFLWNIETTPLTKATRQYYALFHTYWRGEYAHLRNRGLDHYWFSWTIGNNPSLDVTVENAIPFHRVILRLTGVTFFLLRFGSISGGTVSPGGRLTVRPWAWSNLWRRSPYPSDIERVGMPKNEITTWKDYFAYLMGFRLCSLVREDGRPYRVHGDPSFLSFWRQPPPGGWEVISVDGQINRISEATLFNLAKLERQTYISRLRWTFSPQAHLSDFGEAFDEGEEALKRWLESNLTKLYIEVRSDSCPPKNEEFATIALYAGLLANLDAAYKYVAEKYPYSFWKEIFRVCENQPVDIKVSGEWLPDIIHTILDIGRQGLQKRKNGEERYLLPMESRLERLQTPAEEALMTFRAAGEGIAGLRALAMQHGRLEDYPPI